MCAMCYSLRTATNNATTLNTAGNDAIAALAAVTAMKLL